MPVSMVNPKYKQPSQSAAAIFKRTAAEAAARFLIGVPSALTQGAIKNAFSEGGALEEAGKSQEYLDERRAIRGGQGGVLGAEAEQLKSLAFAQRQQGETDKALRPGRKEKLTADISATKAGTEGTKAGTEMTKQQTEGLAQTQAFDKRTEDLRVQTMREKNWLTMAKERLAGTRADYLEWKMEQPDKTKATYGMYLRQKTQGMKPAAIRKELRLRQNDLNRYAVDIRKQLGKNVKLDEKSGKMVAVNESTIDPFEQRMIDEYNQMAKDVAYWRRLDRSAATQETGVAYPKDGGEGAKREDVEAKVVDVEDAATSEGLPRPRQQTPNLQGEEKRQYQTINRDIARVEKRIEAINKRLSGVVMNREDDELQRDTLKAELERLLKLRDRFAPGVRDTE